MLALGALAIMLAVGLLFVLLSQPKRSAAAAVVTTIVVVTLYPSYTPSPLEQAVSTAGTSLLLCAAWLRAGRRDGDESGYPPGFFPFLGFVIVTSVANAAGAETNQAAVAIGQGLQMIALLFVAVRLDNRGRWLVVSVVAALGVVQFVVSVGEEFYGTGALWPRVDGTDNISQRPNYFSEQLTGRALGTTSMMITLGAFAGVALLASLRRASLNLRGLWIVVALLAAATMVFSGTRSAVLALGCALVVWVVVGLRSFWRILALLTVFAGGALVVATQLEVTTLLGFTDFTDSLSFTHRAGILASVSTLLGMEQAFLGHGGVGAGELLTTTLGGADGVPAFDNTYVRELAVSGILGISLLVLAFGRVLLSGSMMSKVVIAFFGAMGMAFDLFTWKLMFALIVLAVAGAFAARTPAEQARAEEPSGEPAEQTRQLSPAERRRHERAFGRLAEVEKR